MTGESDKFEVYKDKRGEFRWRRKAPNGQIVGAGVEGYASRQEAEQEARRGDHASDKWEFYKDKRGEFRWRRKAANGRIVGASIEGSNTLDEAQKNAERQGFSGGKAH